MKKQIIKAGLAMILFISLFVFALNPDFPDIALKVGRNFLEMLQEFVKKDVVGIV